MGKIYIGTSGYNYKHWKGVFYPQDLPQKNWLNYYSRHFNTVEINATFYGSFTRETYEKWKNSTPKDFIFAIKGPRFITHILRLKTEDLKLKNSIKRFFGAASGLGEKLKVVLWQFAPNFKFDKTNKERLLTFLNELPKDIIQVFEFRHKTWFVKEVYELLNKKNSGFVVSESSRFPIRNRIEGKILYIRFHGPSSIYSSSYSKKELENWAQKIKNAKAERTYCYFNNDAQGYAVKNALELKKIIANS